MPQRILKFFLLLMTAAPLLYAAPRSAREWAAIKSADSLDLFIRDEKVGTCIQRCDIDAKAKLILVSISIAASGPMTVEERHNFGFDGKLESASMDLSGGEGTTRWLLAKETPAGWKLTIESAGATKSQHLASVNDNLEKTWLLCRGMKDRTIHVGDVFNDTSLELESGTIIPEKTRCIELPGPQNGFCWVFLTDILHREDTLKVDPSGAIVYESMYPFIAKKKGHTETPIASQLTFADALAVPFPRAAEADEHIALVLDSAMSPDSSVLPWYRHQGNAWVLAGAPGKCSDDIRVTGVSADSFTTPTVTMQSDNIRIRNLADTLVKGSGSRCDSIEACYRWVYTTLDKKLTPTFSNALETLEAGYGDCGEHAVLLGALLRAAKIPARVILGLVYSPDNRGYYYHAWVMAMSHGSWVFVDPALGVFPAIRDRVPLLIDDNGTGAVKVATFMGRIRISYEKATSAR